MNSERSIFNRNIVPASIVEAASREIKWTETEATFSFQKCCNIDVYVWEEEKRLRIKLQMVHIDKKVNIKFTKETPKTC